MRFFLFVVCLLGMMVSRAGQMSSHDYTAVKAKGGLSGAALAAVTAHEDAYLAGAQGPDTTGVVQHILDRYSTGRSVGEETHYNPNKHELAVNMLDAAGTDPQKLAYAIGWISHYVNDIHIHELVNNYGGFYELAPEHHKELEQLETKYVMCEYGDVENFTRSHIRYEKLPASIPTMVYAAYRKTYPSEPLYTSKDPAQLAYFVKRFVEAAGLCAGAHDEFYRSATYAPANGQHRWVSKAVVFPNMPSTDDYDAFLNGIEITNVQAGKDKLTCVVKVHDSKLYGRFMADWDTAAGKATIQTKSVFQLVSAYVAAKPADKAAVRAKLLAAIPSANLDQPLKIANPHTVLDPKVVFPGDRSYKTPLYTCTFTPLGDGAPVTVNGTTKAIAVAKTRWMGSEDGEVTLEIPVPGGMWPYEFTLKVATANRDDFKEAKYYTRSWVQASGSGGVMADSRAMIGEFIPVTITLSKNLAAVPGKRIWLIQKGEYVLGDVPFAGTIRGVKTQFKLDREACNQLPGAPDVPAGMHTPYHNMTAIDEQITGNVLSAKVQCNAPLDNFVGPVTISCIFIDHPPYSMTDGYAAYKAWQAANQRAKPVYDLMEKKAESLSEAQKKQLIAKAEKYMADLRAKGFSEDEIEKKMEDYYFALMTQLGVKITPEQQKLIDAERAADRVWDLKANRYYRVSSVMMLAPFRLALQKPEGWQDTGNRDEWTRRSLRKETEMKTADGRTAMSASATIEILAENELSTEKRFAETHRTLTSTPVQSGEFTGIRYRSGGTPSTNDGYSYSYTDYVLLKHGGLYLRIILSVNSYGRRVTDGQGNVIADGTGAARSAGESLARDLDSMLMTLRLIPGQMPAKP